MLRSWTPIFALIVAVAPSGAAEVKVRVAMPDTCSPTVSPAIVYLEPLAGSKPAATTGAGLKPAVVHQRGLQFEPRVQVVQLGQKVEFTNQDAETHNVHVVTPGYNFSKSMKPNEPEALAATKPGLIRLICDIHSHMRGFVMVAPSPWAKVAKAGQETTFDEVGPGRYRLVAWHEMGEPASREFEVAEGGPVDLGMIELKGGPIVASGPAGPVRPWPEVIDRVGVCLAEARAIVRKPGGLKRARKLAADAYGIEFELSGMETAVRRHLGAARSGGLERQFRGIRAAMAEVAGGAQSAATLTTLSGKLLIDLSRAADDLKQARVFCSTDIGATPADADAAVPGSADRTAQVAALAASFGSIRGLADGGKADDAGAALFDAYGAEFEPLERFLVARAPGEVLPLEARFLAIRGRVEGGARGPALGADLDALHGEIVAALGRAEAAAGGTFAPAFIASLVTILREGVEVILLLAMLVALVAKAGQPGGMAAIRWGVGLAALASVATAFALNSLVGSARGTTRELVEGGVLLAAAGVLFYVSYWLISQTQAKRWADFLKEQVARGSKAGGLATLAVTAFLAVYREGAETALMYQAMLSGQGGSREGLAGVGAGLAIGLVGLGVIAWAIRRSSLRIPLRPFFKVTGWALFAMAVVFAGNGVFELQSAGAVKATPVGWLGLGVPVLGLHPNVQALSVQGILILGALASLILPMLDGPAGRPKAPVAAANVPAA